MSAPENNRGRESGRSIIGDYVGDLLRDIELSRPAMREMGRDSEPFKAMLAHVGHLHLAIPCERVEGTMNWRGPGYWRDASTGLVDGTIMHHGERVRVLDLAKVVLPRDRWRPEPAPEDVLVHPLILVRDASAGLLCDRFGETIMIDSASVTWRSAETRRSWLAGTSLAQSCAILDVDALLALLGLDEAI